MQPTRQYDETLACSLGGIPKKMDLLGVVQCNSASKNVYVRLLKECIGRRALLEGKQVHAHMIAAALESDVFLGNALVVMYAKCGLNLSHAGQVFNKMPKHDSHSWAIIISTYANHGRCEEALALFEKMQCKGITPSKATFVSILKICGNLEALEICKRVHSSIRKASFEGDRFLESTLINMYVKCGSLGDAKQVFDVMCNQDVVSWNSMIAGYAQNGLSKEAISLFKLMQQEGKEPTRVTFISILKACDNLATLEQVHAYIKKYGFDADVFVGSSLISMYAKCGNIGNARQVFNGISEPNAVSWNAIIMGYVQNGDSEEAFTVFEQMQHCKGLKPNAVTYVTILKACVDLAALEWGEQIHASIKENGFKTNVFVGNALIDMYVKCGTIDSAVQVFSEMHERNVLSWGSMIAGYARNGYLEEALMLFEQMQQEGVKTNKVTFIALLKACTDIGALRKLHSCINIYGLEKDAFIGSTLVDMYAKCGSMEDARNAFEEMMGEHNVVSWNALIAGYVHNGRGEEALLVLEQMWRQKVKPNEVTFVSILKACTSLAALEQGKKVHAEIKVNGFNADVFVQNTLIDMYAKCGSVEDARQVFDGMIERNSVSWSAMIAGYAQYGHWEGALALFEEMQEEGVKPNEATFASIFKACANMGVLYLGKRVHSLMIKEKGLHIDAFVRNSLVDMYAKCGSIEEAWRVFREMSKRDVVTWNSMLAGYSRHGYCEEVLALFEQMQSEDIKANEVTLISVIKACASLATLHQCKWIHANIHKNGFSGFVSIGNSLVDMYAKCQRIEDAYRVFGRMLEKDVVSWNVMIAGYAQNGHGEEAITLFKQMQDNEGLKLDKVTFVNVLKACANAASLEHGKEIHASIVGKTELEMDVSIKNTLIDVYAKCRRMKESRRMFNRMCQRDVVSWNALMMGYAQHGDRPEVVSLFEQMQIEGVKPNKVTFVGILKACAGSKDLELGKWVHDKIKRSGLDMDTFIGNALADMYIKCGSIKEARQGLNEMRELDLASYNVMIAGYVLHGHCEEALMLFEQMQRQGVKPDKSTFVSILKACSVVEKLREIQFCIRKNGLDGDVLLGNMLVDMYAKYGSIGDAWQVFSEMGEKNVVSWNSMIGGYAQDRHGKEGLALALALFEQMHWEGVKPNDITFVNILKVCVSLSSLEWGKRVHAFINTAIHDSNEEDVDIFVGNALVDMYAKCGSIETAMQVFKGMRKHDVISWSAVIAGLTQHGYSKDAVALLEEMRWEGVKPNKVTFTSLLSACSHMGLVKEAHLIFKSMSEDYGIVPTTEHYACIVDLLCRMGQPAEALDFIKKMPIQPNVAVWMALLGTRTTHDNHNLFFKTPLDYYCR